MTGNYDYGSEIMALFVLTALGALSHFWLIMLAICAVSALAGVGLLLPRIILRVQRLMLAIPFIPARRKEYDGESKCVC